MDRVGFASKQLIVSQLFAPLFPSSSQPAALIRYVSTTTGSCVLADASACSRYGLRRRDGGWMRKALLAVTLIYTHPLSIVSNDFDMFDEVAFSVVGKI